MKYFGIIFLSTLLFSVRGYSMKPAPPEIVKIKKDGYKIVSEPRNVSGKDLTKIFKSNFFQDEFLFEFNSYIGSKALFISPDGLTIVLFGNVYFGSTVSDNEESIVLEIRGKGMTTISYSYQEVTGRSLASDIKKNDLPTMGGGWVSIQDILSLEAVDWAKKSLKFKQVEKSWK